MQQLSLLLQELMTDLAVREHVITFGIGIARLLIFISFVPFFGNNVNMAVKFPILLALYMPVHPILFEQVAQLDVATVGGLLNYFVLMVKEGIIGFALAFVVGNIFYIGLGAGIIIDNQRGASQAQGPEIMTGIDSSPLGSVLFLAMVTLFFASGAFVNFLSLYYSTYLFWPPFDYIPGVLSSNFAIFMANEVDWLMTQALLVCAPFVLVALMCDIALGLINRFAPQLNVFILSMPIKSGVCSLLIIFYIGPYFEHSKILFLHIYEVVKSLEILLPS